MSPAVATRPLLDRDLPRAIGRTGPAGRPSGSSDGGGLTLEQKLDCVWEGLRAGGAAECPVCQGTLAGGARGHGARCGDCGSRLG